MGRLFLFFLPEQLAYALTVCRRRIHTLENTWRLLRTVLPDRYALSYFQQFSFHFLLTDVTVISIIMIKILLTVTYMLREVYV